MSESAIVLLAVLALSLVVILFVLLTRHRPHWKELDVEVLLDRVAEEIDELCDAIASGDRKAVVRECADVANFVMMIADNAQWDGTRGWNSHEGI